ncbi:hypothetical protein M3Y99_01079500 [Aphelenchoides fujianensis]|nr:hypothetical protein M3Y99_01079500 [Aphelenchoides fujianensis]
MDILLKKKKRRSRLEATARIEVRLQPPSLGGYTEINFDELCDQLDIVDKRTGDEDAEFVDDEEELGEESDASSTASGAPAVRHRRPGAGGEAGERMATALMRKGVGYDLDDPFVDDSDLHVSIPQPNATGPSRAARDRFPLFGGFFVNAADEIEAAPVEADEPAVAEVEASGAEVPKKQRRSRKIQLEEVGGATAETNNGVETTASQEPALTQPTATSDEKQRKRKAAGDPPSSEPKRMVGRAPNAKKVPQKELGARLTAGEAEKSSEQREAPSPAAPLVPQPTTDGEPPPSVPPIKQRRRPGPKPKEKPKEAKKRRIMTTAVPNATSTDPPAPQPTAEPSPASSAAPTAPTVVEPLKAKSPLKPPAVAPAPAARKSPVPSTSAEPPAPPAAAAPDAGAKLVLLKTFLERAKTFKEKGGSPDVRAELEQMAVVLFGSNANAKQWTGGVAAKTSANGTSGSSPAASQPPGSSAANPPARSPGHPSTVAVETATSSAATSAPTPPKPTIPIVPPSAAPPTPPKAPRPAAPMRMAGLFKPRAPRTPAGSLVGRPPTAKRKVGISFPETPEKNPPAPSASSSSQPPPPAAATTSAGSKWPQSISSVAPKAAPPPVSSHLPLPPTASSTAVLPNLVQTPASSGLQPQASVRAASPRTAAASNGTPASRPANGVHSTPPKSNGQPAASNSQTAAGAEIKRPSNPPTTSAAASTPKATLPQFQLTAQQQAAILEQLKARPMAEIQRLYAALGAQMEAAAKAVAKPPAPSKPPASAAKTTIPKVQQPPQRAAPVQKPKPPPPAVAQPPPTAPINRPNVSIATNGTTTAVAPQAAGLQPTKPPVPSSSFSSNANRGAPTSTSKAAVDPNPQVLPAVPVPKPQAPPRPPPPAVQQQQVDAAMLRGYEQQLNALYAAQIQSISALQFSQMSPQQQRALLAAVPQLLAQQQRAAASSAAAATRKS